MNFESQTTRAIDRVQRALGREIEVYNFTYDPSGADNPYAEGEFIATDESPTTVHGRIEQNRRTDEANDDSGVDVVTELTLFVPHSTDVRIAGDAESETKATEFVDTETGARYRAVDAHRQSDLLAVQIESI